MKLSLLSETDKLGKQPKKQMKKVWQDEESQGYTPKRWYSPNKAPKKYRWGTGKPMSGDGYDEHILPPGHV